MLTALSAHRACVTIIVRAGNVLFTRPKSNFSELNLVYCKIWSHLGYPSAVSLLVTIYNINN